MKYSTLRCKSEGAGLDFKQAQYRFVKAGEKEKAEVLKDILAIANAWREGVGYILIGFKDNSPHPAEVVGITEHLDDASVQQFVNSKVKPKLDFRYEECIYEGKAVGIITIPKQQRLLEPIGNIPPAEFEALYEQSQAALSHRPLNSNQMASAKPGAVQSVEPLPITVSISQCPTIRRDSTLLRTL